MSDEVLKQLAAELQRAAVADIYYDAGYFNDEAGVYAIEEATEAMTNAAEFLSRIADSIDNDYVFPSDDDRAESEALDTACNFIEAFLSTIQPRK